MRKGIITQRSLLDSAPDYVPKVGKRRFGYSP